MDLGRDRGFIPMTRTEMKCLQLTGDGLSDQEIGKSLELTASEVASVLSVVMLKLRVPNRMAGLAKASRMGLLCVDRSGDENLAPRNPGDAEC